MSSFLRPFRIRSSRPKCVSIRLIYFRNFTQFLGPGVRFNQTDRCVVSLDKSMFAFSRISKCTGLDKDQLWGKIIPLSLQKELQYLSELALQCYDAHHHWEWWCLTHFPFREEALNWRHNWRDDVSNHQPHDCLLNRLFRRRSKKTAKLRVTGLCEGKSPVISEFLAQRASNAEYVSIWWRHHDEICYNRLQLYVCYS